jgi:hypothetical protein
MITRQLQSLRVSMGTARRGADKEVAIPVHQALQQDRATRR